MADTGTSDFSFPFVLDLSSNLGGMDSTVVESPSDVVTPTADAAALSATDSLAVYLASVPYQCENEEEMQAKLEVILSRFVIACRCRDWRSLSTWVGMLQCWLAMKYPLHKSARIKLVKLCYELILVSKLHRETVPHTTTLH